MAVQMCFRNAPAATALLWSATALLWSAMATCVGGVALDYYEKEAACGPSGRAEERYDERAVAASSVEDLRGMLGLHAAHFCGGLVLLGVMFGMLLGRWWWKPRPPMDFKDYRGLVAPPLQAWIVNSILMPKEKRVHFGACKHVEARAASAHKFCVCGDCVSDMNRHLNEARLPRTS